MKTILTILLIAFSVSVSGQIKEPFLHYSFDNTLIDSMLTGYNLTAYDNATFSASDKAVGSHSGLLDGGDDRFKTPTITLSDTVLFSVWVKSDVAISGVKEIISDADTTTVNTTSLRIYIDGNIIKFKIGNIEDARTASSFTWTDWVHVVALLFDDGTRTIVRCWVNGVRATMSDSIINTYAHNPTRYNLGVDVYLNHDWDGNFDEFRVYNKLIPTEAKIDSLYVKSYIGGYTEPGYNPVAGVHTQPTYRGVLLKPTYRGLDKYWLAKNPLIITLNTIGIYADIRSGDYDGVCPSGATRWTDTDCASQDFSYSPLRKIPDTTDYATKVYIDPTYGSGGDGSLAAPYDSWSDITVATNTAYLIKKGTTLNVSTALTIDQSGVLLGSYGTGDKPRIVHTLNGHVVIIENSNCTVRDVIIDNKTSLDYCYNNEITQSSANISMQGYYTNTDIFNVEMRRGVFGIGTSDGNHETVRVINCVIDSMFTEGIYAYVRDYLEVAWTTISHINIAYEINVSTTWKGTNSWATGDGIQRIHYYGEDGWREMWVHHSTIDRRPYGNKACIMYQNENALHIRDITEFNIFYAPLFNGISGQGSQILNSEAEGRSSFYNNILYGVDCDYTTGGLYHDAAGHDTISGNIFVDLDVALYGRSGDVIENNTFYNNRTAISASSEVAKLYNNIFWLNTTNYSSGTPVSYGNNLYSDPEFVNVTGFDFKLQSTSDAIDVGISIPYRLYDIEGIAIPQNSITDVGAHEYIP